MFERFSDRARRVVVLSQEEAPAPQPHYIGTEHILLGLVHEGGVSPPGTRSLGIRLDAVRREVEEIIGRGESTPSGHIPFTPRAKKVLELSSARPQLGHNYIGTEHILLGLLREGGARCGGAGRRPRSAGGQAGGAKACPPVRRRAAGFSSPPRRHRPGRATGRRLGLLLARPGPALGRPVLDEHLLGWRRGEGGGEVARMPGHHPPLPGGGRAFLTAPPVGCLQVVGPDPEQLRRQVLDESDVAR